MKKTFVSIALFLCVSLVLSGCSLVVTKINDEIKDEITDVKEEIKEEVADIKEEVKEIADNFSGGTIESVKELSEKEVIEALSEHLAAFDEVIKESFGAQIDDKTYYFAAYRNELQEESGELDDDTLLLDANGTYNLPSGYVADPAAVMYFVVTNYKTQDEIERRYEKFMGEDVFEELLEMNFEEHKGTLYLVRGGRGYGAVSIDKDSAEVLAKVGNTYVVKVQKVLFDEPADEAFYLNVEKDINGFKITGFEETFVGNPDEPAKTDEF